MAYQFPAYLEDTSDIAANLSHFLLANGRSIFGTWSGTMSARDQRRLFGRYLGKGKLVINGATETVKLVVSVCFGQDFEVRESATYRDLMVSPTSAHTAPSV